MESQTIKLLHFLRVKNRNKTIVYHHVVDLLIFLVIIPQRKKIWLIRQVFRESYFFWDTSISIECTGGWKIL